jgi:hypothetical protein
MLINLISVLALAIGPNGITQQPQSHIGQPKIILASADNTLGVAVMSAVVGGDGIWARGTIGTSSLKTAGGTYTVQFPRDVSACAYVATLGDTSTALPPTG